MNFDEAVEIVSKRGPNHYAKVYAQAMSQAIQEAKMMKLPVEQGKAIQANYILANLEDYPTDEMQCLNCKKTFDELEFEDIDNCPNCNSNDFDVEYRTWDTEIGIKVRQTLREFIEKVNQ